MLNTVHRARYGLAGAVLLLSGAALADAPAPTAIFPVELWDTSGEGTGPAQAGRIALVSARVQAMMTESGRYAAVDLAPFKERIGSVWLRDCGTCATTIARDAGAHVALLTAVHKISTLILSFRILLVDADTGAVLREGKADIRGDNDKAWLRGAEWIMEHRILSAAP